jgi:hypothetical protein
VSRAVAAFVAVAALVAVTAVTAAQGGGKPATGNPTPGTAQPDPPNVANRVMFAGCLQRAAGTADKSADPFAPSNSRFELVRAAPVERAEPGTGPSADGTQAAGASSTTYRLEGIDSIFSPFVGSRVEITGAVKPPSKAEKGAPPTLVVEFLQRIAAKCS